MIVGVVHPPGASSVPLGFNVSVAATRCVRGAATENDVGSAHCVACGRRVNAPEAGNEGLRDSVAAAATEGDVWSMYASAAGATSTTGPSETTGSDVAGPLPPPSGPRGDVLPAPRSADISSPARLHGDNPTPEPLERSNRPRSTLPLVALGAAVAVVLACVGLALAVRFGDGDDDADTGSLGGDTKASTAVSSRSVTPTTVRGGGHCDDGSPRDERGHHRSCGGHSQCAAVVDGFGAPRRPARHRPSSRRARCPRRPPRRHGPLPSQAQTAMSAPTCSTIRCHRGCAAPSSRRPCRPLQRLADTLASGDWNTARESRSRLGNGQRRGAGRWIRQPGPCDAATRRCSPPRRQR